MLSKTSAGPLGPRSEASPGTPLTHRDRAVTTHQVSIEQAQRPVGTQRRHVRPRTLGGWCLSTALLLLLGGLFPLLFTQADLGSLLEPPVLLSLVITEWAALRLVRLIGRGEARLVQTTFWIFVYVWLGLAALAETVAQRFPIAGQTFSGSTQFRALLAVITGLAAYELGLAAHRSVGAPNIAHWLETHHVHPRRVWAIAAGGAAGTVFALWNHGLGLFFTSRYSAAEAVYGQPAPGLRLDQVGNKAVGLLHSTIMWAPAFLALYLLVLLRSTSKGAVRQRSDRLVSSPAAPMLLIGLIVANLIVNNPISSPRYRFGGIVLALVAVGWPLHNPRRFRIWGCGLLVGVLFAFPVLDIFRYDDRHIEFTPLKEQLLTSPDFGVFQQEVNAQVYVDEHGFTVGEQILGVVLGYVPRAVWEGKPIDTGNVIARTNAINASASPWATMFVDGGFLAVAVTFFVYGRLTKMWEELYLRKSREPSFISAAVPLYAGFQIILLRGDLQPAVGQLAPLLIILLFAIRKEGRSSTVKEVAVQAA